MEVPLDVGTQAVMHWPYELHECEIAEGRRSRLEVFGFVERMSQICLGRRSLVQTVAYCTRRSSFSAHLFDEAVEEVPRFHEQVAAA